MLVWSSASSGFWMEGYNSGKLMRHRLTHNSYGEYIGEENISPFKRG